MRLGLQDTDEPRPIIRRGKGPFDKNYVILRSARALARERLEGWPQARCLLPSFETAARKHARPPQDEVVFVSRAFKITLTRGHAPSALCPPYDSNQNAVRWRIAAANVPSSR